MVPAGRIYAQSSAVQGTAGMLVRSETSRRESKQKKQVHRGYRMAPPEPDMPPTRAGRHSRAWLYATSPDPDDVIAHGLKILYQPLALSALPDDLAVLMGQIDRAERRQDRFRETAERTAARTQS